MPRATPFKRKRRRAFRSTANKRTANRQLAIMKRSARITLNSRSGGFLGIEDKFVDHFEVNKDINVTWDVLDPGTFLSIGGAAQNTSQNGRDGRRFAINAIFFRGYITLPLEESNVNPRAASISRIILV